MLEQIFFENYSKFLIEAKLQSFHFKLQIENNF